MIPWKETYNAVMDACDGAEGFVDDGSGKRILWPPPPRAQWFASLIAAKVAAGKILALREAAEPFRYCFGSGKPPKKLAGYRQWSYTPLGVCRECDREVGLTTEGKMTHHRAMEGRRALATENKQKAPCPTCGVQAGQKCLTIYPVKTWDGKDLGRVPLPRRQVHKARLR